MVDRESTSNYFRDCKKPTLEPINGIISGVIPTWLEGTLIRNGAGIQTVGSDHFQHYFDGLSILHRFYIKNGQVTYNSRPLESEAYKANMAAGKILIGGFGTMSERDPCDSLFSKFKSVFLGKEGKKSRDLQTDNCNVNVGYFGDQLYAMTETIFTRRFDPVTLETVGEKIRLDKYVPLNQVSAHPHILPNGTMITMGVNYQHNKGPHYVVIEIPPTYGSESPVFERAKIIAEIPARWKLFPSYSHSFALAGENVIFVEQPFCFSLPRFFFGKIRRQVFSSCFQWWPNQTTRIRVVSILNGERKQIVYETTDLFIFHHVNAFEEDGHIILDVSGYNSGELVSVALGYTTMNKNCQFQNSLRRYVLPLEIPKDATNENLISLKYTKAMAKLRAETSNVIDLIPEILHPNYFEFPRINYEYNGKKYRFAYGATSSKNDMISFTETNQISKMDLETHEILSWDGGESVLVSEPVFIPNPDVKFAEEDDGILLLSQLHLEDELKVSLVILDAKNMTLVGKAEFQAEGTVTATFHGQWAQSGQLVHKY